MDMIIFIGIPASGKSSFYKQNFFNSHVRVSLDLLRTRNRENRLLDFCLQTLQPLVVDNTCVTASERQKYIRLAKAHSFRVRGFYFQSRTADCLARNAQRRAPEQIPEKGVVAKAKQMQLPSLAEGFDELQYVQLVPPGFVVSPWQTENL